MFDFWIFNTSSGVCYGLVQAIVEAVQPESFQTIISPNEHNIYSITELSELIIS